MAALTSPHWEAVSTQTRELLIAQQILLDDLFARSADKYPRSRGFGMRVLAALVDFDTADQQDDPIILLPVTWDQVKNFFVAEARRLGEKWLT